MPLRVGCIQLDSKHAAVHANADTVARLTADLDDDRGRNPYHLLVLPELALTGYVFDHAAHIQPLLEPTPTPAAGPGPTLALAQTLATRYRCYVLAGFPEHAGPRAHNSALLVDSHGTLLHTFRKHFLYHDDKRWATPGPGFQAIQLPGIGTICVAICMDLNPHDFTAPFDAYELATFCVREHVRLLVMPMAWLLPTEEHHLQPTTPSLSTINYWASRCRPFLQTHSSDPSSPPPSPSETRLISDPVPRYLIAANRTGSEGTSTFAGSSCVLEFTPGHRPVLLGALGTSQEAVLTVDLPLTPPT